MKKTLLILGLILTLNISVFAAELEGLFGFRIGQEYSTSKNKVLNVKPSSPLKFFKRDLTYNLKIEKGKVIGIEGSLIEMDLNKQKKLIEKATELRKLIEEKYNVQFRMLRISDKKDFKFYQYIFSKNNLDFTFLVHRTNSLTQIILDVSKGVTVKEEVFKSI